MSRERPQRCPRIALRSDAAWVLGAGRISLMRCLMVVGWLALVPGCSGGEPDAASSARQSRVPDDHVFSDQVRALEKAEGVENMLLQGAERRRQAIDEQTQ